MARRQLTEWLARVDDRFMGTPVDVDPHEAIIHAIRICAGEVAYCDAQISRLSEDELFERPLNVTVTQLPFSKNEVEVTEQRDAEVISRWVVLRDNAADRMVKYADKAISLGIDERRVRIAERVADVLYPLLMNLDEDLQLTAEQRRRLPDVIGARLKSLEATTMEDVLG